VATALSLLATVAPAGELRGRLVQWTSSEPVVGVTLQALPFESPRELAFREARGTPAPEALAEATTDGRGGFAIRVPAGAPGAVRLAISGGGFVAVSLERALPADADLELGEIRVGRGA